MTEQMTLEQARDELRSMHVKVLLSDGSDVADAIDAAIAELDASHDLRDRLTKILTDTANALKGKPDALTIHSWHDLAEVAAAVVTERDELRRRIESAPVVVSAPGPWGMLEMNDPVSGDLAELPTSMEGKRVRLVVDDD